jgi:PKHD-type hydroxylase
MHIQKWFSLSPFFDEEKVDKILEITKTSQLMKAGTLSKGGKFRFTPFARNCKSGWIHEEPNNIWLFSEILNAVDEINKRTLKFDLRECSIEPLQYLEYGPLQFYNRHVDNGADQVACRKYSVSIQLSHPSDYLGGKLKIFGQGQSPYAPRERGSMAIFPSHILHQARPVWFGKRKVLVAWIRGKTTLS